MSSLSKRDKDIILDFYFRCGSDEHIQEAVEMIAGNPEASEVYASLESALKDLDIIKYEPCPDNLAAITIARLKQAAASQRKLENLLEAEQTKEETNSTITTTHRGFWRNIAEVATIAAMLFITASVFFPVSSKMRAAGRQRQCASNLQRIGASIAGYANDHNGNLPSVAMAAGAPWWKIGDQGQANESNTRHPWQLVKQGYIDGRAFFCPGRKGAKIVQYTPQQLSQLNDFPDRKHISYSFIHLSARSAQRQRAGKVTVLMADLNPVFEKLFTEKKANMHSQNNFTRIMINQQLRQMMSSNHRSKGQNVLLTAGSAEFKKNRLVFDDDIYTIKGTNSYQGCEATSDENDFFLAP